MITFTKATLIRSQMERLREQVEIKGELEEHENEDSIIRKRRLGSGWRHGTYQYLSSLRLGLR